MLLRMIRPSSWKSGMALTPESTTFAFPKIVGPAYARMVGVKAARTEWIAFLDSDDVWLPDHLEKAAQIIAENPHVRFIYAQRGHINKNSELIIEHISDAW
jgi:glycosyltransferase involved in cell wall biosynthesis